MKLSERSAIKALAARLGRPFLNPDLLECALAHRSWCAETVGSASNERLEFLGDAVLGLVVTDHLFRAYPELPEGELAKVRSSLVNSEALAEVASQLGVGEALLLGKGEGASGGREKPSILADAMEAVIGAVYIDGGWAAARELVLGLLAERIEEAAAGPGGQDYKTRLQELAARRFDQLPRYEVRDEGPDHAKRFFATVDVGGVATGAGEGRSKKQAEQAAARVAWLALQTAAGKVRAAAVVGPGEDRLPENEVPVVVGPGEDRLPENEVPVVVGPGEDRLPENEVPPDGLAAEERG